MDIIKITAIALSGCVLAIFLKEYNKNFGFLVSLITGSIIAAIVLPYFSDFALAFKRTCEGNFFTTFFNY